MSFRAPFDASLQPPQTYSITLKSDSNTEEFPFNSACSFLCRLADPIKLEGSYDVAVTELRYTEMAPAPPPTPKPVPLKVPLFPGLIPPTIKTVQLTKTSNKISDCCYATNELLLKNDLSLRFVWTRPTT